MNILIFSSDNDKASGAFRSMARMAYYLKTLDTNVYIVISRSGDGIELLDEYNIPYYMIRSYNWIIRTSKAKSLTQNTELKLKMVLNQFTIAKVCKLIKELKIDLVHVNTSWSYIGAVAAKKCSIPYVWHIREFLEEDQNVQFFDRCYAIKLLNSADKIICISQSIRDKYANLVDNRLLSVIYNGLEPSTYLGRKNVPFSQKKLNFLIVGTVCEQKGQWQLIDACSLLLKEGLKNFMVKVLGKGKDEYIAFLKNRCVELGLSEYVEFCGYRNNTEDYYKDADITFVCSKSEAFGRVTVEAMMSGSLVIGADAAATFELVEDKVTGLLYKSGNPSQLAATIKWALANKDETAQIARCGQKFMVDNMSALKNAKCVRELYCNILGFK